MNADLLAKLKVASQKINTPYTKEFISPNGRQTYEVYSPEMGTFTIHVCETAEDVQASNEGRW